MQLIFSVYPSGIFFAIREEMPMTLAEIFVQWATCAPD